MKVLLDCIIPFYNEGDRVLSVVGAFSRVKSISRIICVDDGSTDHASEEIQKKYPKAILIRHDKKEGKSSAIFSGLRKVKSKYVMLFDGDLEHVLADEIETACNKFFSNSNLDSLILRANGEKRYKLMDDLFRNYIVQSGNRIIKTADLRAVEKFHPTGYQMEVAINQYMMDAEKSVAWYPISALNPHKTEKLSFVEGWKKDFAMDREIMSYLGPVKRIQQILFFCRQRLV